MKDYVTLHAELNAQHYDPRNDRNIWPVSAVICLGALHAEADQATPRDFPITGEEIDALTRQAKQNPRDAILTALAIGRARHDKF